MASTRASVRAVGETGLMSPYLTVVSVTKLSQTGLGTLAGIDSRPGRQ